MGKVRQVNSDRLTACIADDRPFVGAKLALFVGDRIVVLLRDDRPDIPYPNHWDLPGGGREGFENGWACAVRETQEEVGLRIPDAAFRAGRYYPTDAGGAWFFRAQLPDSAESQIRFGNEGQAYALWTPKQYLEHPQAIPHFQDRLRDCLSG